MEKNLINQEIASNEIKNDASIKEIKKDASISIKRKKDAKKEDASKKKLEDANINLLSKFDERLKGMDIKNSSSLNGKSEYIYNYPSEWGKKEINGMEGKNYRNKRRSNLQSICNNIFFYAKGKNMIELNKSILAFDENYKSHYRINDYSIQSLSNSNDASKNSNIQFALDIIKEMKGNK